MHGGIAVNENQEDEKNPLNNEEDLDSPKMNRGFELLLRNRKRREPPKTFQLKFRKKLSLFGRVFSFFLDTHIDVRKKED